MSSKNIIVIKLGSNVIMKENGSIDTTVIDNVVTNIAHLITEGFSPVIVSSGAVASGKEYFSGIKPNGIVSTLFAQICSSLGQPILMRKYEESFSRFGLHCSQNLLTQNDFKSPTVKSALAEVIDTALSLGIIPIVNENDVIAKEEIVFSDNDVLAADLALLLHAKKLILLSVIDGFYNGNPQKGAKIFSHISHITDEHYSYVQEEKSTLGRGGMKSKLDTAKILLKHGIDMHVASGKQKDVLIKIINGEVVGTKFAK